MPVFLASISLAKSTGSVVPRKTSSFSGAGEMPFLRSVAHWVTRVVQVLEGYTAGDLMTADPPVIQPQLSVGAVVRGVIDLNPRLCYFVEEHGKLAGILSAYQVRLLPEARWDSTTVGEAMIPSARLHAVAPSQPGSEVLLEMENADLTHVPVVQDGQVMGVVGRDRILSILREKGFLRSAAV